MIYVYIGIGIVLFALFAIGTWNSNDSSDNLDWNGDGIPFD